MPVVPAEPPDPYPPLKRHECLTCGHQWVSEADHCCPECGNYAVKWLESGTVFRACYVGDPAKPR